VTIEFRLDGSLLPYQTVRLVGEGGVSGLPAAAWFCEPAIAGIQIEDQSNSSFLAAHLQGWHVFTVDETACSKPRIFTGWIIGRRISRMRDSNRTTFTRVWDCDIIDQNALFSFQVFRANSAIRPAETDLARVAWAIASAPMATTPVHDDGRFNTTDNPGNLSETNFVRQYPIDLFSSCAGQTGKNVYAYWDDSAGNIGIHYDLLGVGPSATVQISNVESDITRDAAQTITGNVYYPLRDAELTRSPDDQYTGILLDYVGGAVYGENNTLIDDLSPTSLSPSTFKRDLMISSDRISRLATANAQLATQLDIHADEKDTIICTIRVPNTKVNLINAGDIATVRFSHIPGYETATPLAITRRNVVPTRGVHDSYDIRLEMRNWGVRSPGGGDAGDTPQQGGCDPQLVGSTELVQGSGTFVGSGMDIDWTPSSGDLNVIYILVRSAYDLTPTGYTGIGSWQSDPSGTKSMQCRFFYRICDGTEGTHIAFTNTSGSNNFTYVNVSGWTDLGSFHSLDTATETTSQNADPFLYASNLITGITPGSAGLMMSALMPSLNINDPWFPSPTGDTGPFVTTLGKPGETGGSEAKGWLAAYPFPHAAPSGQTAFSIEDTPAGGISRGSAYLVAWFDGECTDTGIPPVGGVGIQREFIAYGDGTTTAFNTHYAYLPGSLRVFVDAVEIVNGLTETDPVTGAFTLDFAPLAASGDTRAEIVTAWYQVHT
jgi:hypothetical protein